MQQQPTPAQSGSNTAEAGVSMAAFVAAIQWNNEVMPLQKTLACETPAIVKFHERPGINNSNRQTLLRKVADEALLLYSVVCHRKVICHCIGGKSSSSQAAASSTAAAPKEQEQRFSIPMAYEGWFEILSEDGQALPPLRRVSELVDHADLPLSFLVRERVKAYSAEAAVKGSYPTQELTLDKDRIVQCGEVMRAVATRAACTAGWRRQRMTVLHCIDATGCDIYFDCRSQGKFNVVATEAGGIGGVHRIGAVIANFRLPLTVRVVSGQVPSVAIGGSSPGTLRLTDVQSDTTALLLPLSSGSKLVPVSTRASFEVLLAHNTDTLKRRPEYSQLQTLCCEKVDKYFKTIQVLVSTGGDVSKVGSQQVLPTVSEADNGGDVCPDSPVKRHPTYEEDLLFQEVDDLYKCVRRGGQPPTRTRPLSWATQRVGSSSQLCSDGEAPTSTGRLISSNGVERGQLAVLTNGRFPKSGTALCVLNQQDGQTKVTGKNESLTSSRSFLRVRTHWPTLTRRQSSSSEPFLAGSGAISAVGNLRKLQQKQPVYEAIDDPYNEIEARSPSFYLPNAVAHSPNLTLFPDHCYVTRSEEIDHEQAMALLATLGQRKHADTLEPQQGVVDIEKADATPTYAELRSLSEKEEDKTTDDVKFPYRLLHDRLFNKETAAARARNGTDVSFDSAVYGEVWMSGNCGGTGILPQRQPKAAPFDGQASSSASSKHMKMSSSSSPLSGIHGDTLGCERTLSCAASHEKISRSQMFGANPLEA